jgi:cell division protein FtsI/penicillin-binding protein 2
MSVAMVRAASRCLCLLGALSLAHGCARRPPAAKVVVSPPPSASAESTPGQEAQRAVDDVLAASNAPAAAVVLDIEGPRVLALGGHQGADPVTQARRPGSTVKPLIAWLAAEHGLLAPRDVVTCDRAFPGPEGFHCFDRHGPLDLPSAITVSCNVYFMELGVRLGLGRVAAGLTSFGLARRTGLAAGEVDGFVATPEWVASTPGLPAMRREAVIAAGHGPLEVTLLELAVAYAALAQRLSSSRSHVSDATRREILDGLRRVVNDPNGTGRAAAVPGRDLAGKTGTAEATSFAEEQRGVQNRAENGWFVGFTPSARPRRVIAVVVLGQGGAAKTAAPLAGRLFERLR